MKQSDRKMNRKISPFITKLFNIIENPLHHDSMSWVSPNVFMVVDSDDLSQNVLRKYFKHNNFSSFIRQLNIYGFEKVKTEKNTHCYHHKNFIQNNRRQLKLIRRKAKKLQSVNSRVEADLIPIEAEKNGIEIEQSIRQLQRQNEKIQLENKMLHQQIHQIQIQNKREIEKILGFLSALTKKIEQSKVNSVEDYALRAQMLSRLQLLLVNQKSGLSKGLNQEHKVDFSSIFNLLNSVIDSSQQSETNNEQNISKRIEIERENDPGIGRNEQNPFISEDNQEQSQQKSNNCLCIDNFF